METSVLRVAGVHKSYDGVAAVDGVDLDLHAGTVHGLLGPNGAGKTTLLRIVLGLVQPDSGTVEVLGVPRRPGVPVEGLAGFVDAPRTWPYLTGRRTLELLARLDGTDGRDIGKVLHDVGLSERADSRVGTWSVGMRQRLGLAAALLRDPRVLVLDEPTSGLDPRGVVQVHHLLRGLAASGTAVLLSSHDMAEVASLCDAVTVVARGRVVWNGPTADLRPASSSATYRLATTDDDTALEVTAALGAERRPDCLVLTATQDQMDAAVLALAERRVAVRSLVPDVPPAVRAFLELTA